MPNTFIGKKNAINNLYENAINVNANTSPSNYTPAGSSVKDDLDGIDVALAANFPVVSDTNTNRILALSDRNTLQLLDNTSTITVTVPPASSVAFPENGATIINFIQINTGQITFAAGAGVTIRSYLNKISTAGQYASCSLVYTTADIWFLYGALI